MKGWLSASLALAATVSAEDAPVWRDAVLGLRTDATGAVWNFQENGELGRVGASAVNRGQMLLVNGEAFAAQSAYMTEDGSEFLVSGQTGGAQESLIIVRRIRLEANAGLVRYLELLRNEGRAPRNVQVELRTNLNGYYQKFLSSSGREMPVALEPSETGFWLAPDGGKEGGRGYAFALASPGAAIRPVLGSKQSYVVSAYFDVVIAPGETVGILHGIRQTPMETGAEPARLAGVFAGMDLAAMRAGLPRTLRDCLCNVGPQRQETESPFFREVPGIRQPGDVVSMDGGGGLRGQWRPGRFILNTARGKLDVEVEDVVAVASAGAGKGEVSVWLRGGEVVTGGVSGDVPKFALTSGAELTLRWEGLQDLRRSRDQDVDQTAAWVRTAQGEQLRLDANWAGVETRWETPFGPLACRLQDVHRLQEHEGLRLSLRDGTRVSVSPASGGALPLAGSCQGAQLPLAEVRGLWLPQAESAKQPAPAEGVVELLSGNRLSWRANGERLDLETVQGRLAVPLAQVRRLERAGGSQFQIALWDGSRFPASVPGDQPLVLQGAGTWKIPWQDLQSLTAGPQGALTLRGPEIEAALQALCSEEWKTRHQAEETLRRLGELSLGRLRQVRDTGDADFRHRVGLLIEELETEDAGER